MISSLLVLWFLFLPIKMGANSKSAVSQCDGFVSWNCGTETNYLQEPQVFPLFSDEINLAERFKPLFDGRVFWQSCAKRLQIRSDKKLVFSIQSVHNGQNTY